MFELFVLIFLALTLVFLILRLAPGDPIEKLLGPRATLEEVSFYKEQLGLDMSLFSQYIHYLSQTVKMDFGESLFKKEKVLELVSKSMGPSLFIGIFSVLFSFILGSVLGVIASVFKKRSLDYAIRLFSLLGLSFPIFSLAPILTLLFAIKLQFFPVSEWGELKHIFLPVITLTIPLTAILIRVVRTRFLDDLSEPWVLVLKSKGLKDIDVYKRVFKLTLPTILNVVALQLSVVLGGTIITEAIFDIPGMGQLLFEAIQNRDYPLVQGVIVYITVIYLVVYFLIEELNKLLDPRMDRNV